MACGAGQLVKGLALDRGALDERIQHLALAALLQLLQIRQHVAGGADLVDERLAFSRAAQRSRQRLTDGYLALGGLARPQSRAGGGCGGGGRLPRAFFQPSWIVACSSSEATWGGTSWSGRRRPSSGQPASARAFILRSNSCKSPTARSSVDDVVDLG